MYVKGMNPDDEDEESLHTAVMRLPLFLRHLLDGASLTALGGDTDEDDDDDDDNEDNDNDDDDEEEDNDDSEQPQ
jgi:hypothetical protein